MRREQTPLHPSSATPLTHSPPSPPRTLNDVFLHYTGAAIRDEQTDGVGSMNRAMMRAMAGARR